jgi:uncharacterized protein YjbI with pentapeptide repeats
VNFTQAALFYAATFTQDSDFEYASFSETANWSECQFLDHAKFRQTIFTPEVEGTASTIFSLAKFAKPQDVIFDDVDLSRVLFLNCNVSDLWFTSSVR